MPVACIASRPDEMFAVVVETSMPGMGAPRSLYDNLGDAGQRELLSGALS
jgi:hypothetical protein